MGRDLDLASEDGGGHPVALQLDAKLGAEVDDVSVAGLDDKALGGFGPAQADKLAGVEPDGVVVFDKFDSRWGLNGCDRPAVGRNLCKALGQRETVTGLQGRPRG